MESSLTLYKLIILYMLTKVNFPMTNAQISDFILGEEYTSYFHLQQALSEMAESNLVHVETLRNTSYYHLTREGERTLHYFGNQISDAIKEDISRYLEQNSYELRNEVSTRADYYQTDSGEYEARCQVLERRHKVIELTLTVPTEEAANAICTNWAKKSQDVYAHLMDELLK